MFTCHHCQKNFPNDEATVYHLIPKWLYSNAPHLAPKFRKNLGLKNKALMCRNCNQKKNGSIYVKHEVPLHFWLDVRAEIDRKIQETYGVDNSLDTTDTGCIVDSEVTNNK
jgi:hypothetical protein